MTVPIGGKPIVRIDASTHIRLLVSHACEESRHDRCDGYSRLARDHPKIIVAAQVLPCLCDCHGEWSEEARMPTPRIKGEPRSP